MVLRVEMFIHARMLVIISSTIASPEALSPQRLYQTLAGWSMKTDFRSSAIMLVYTPSLPATEKSYCTPQEGSDSPFILVPRGSPFFPISAHALSSNRTTIPSFLCTFFFVLTMMACLTSPLLTLFAAAIPPAPPVPARLSPSDLVF